MRFSRVKRRTSVEKGQLDIAPLIDVVFLLLIFFMLTSNFVFQPGIKVSIPKLVTSEVISSEHLVITLTAQDLLFLNDEPITVEVLKDKMKQAARENRSLLLKADSGASLGRVTQIWDLCREVGIPQVNIATNQRAGDRA